jgi:hypothetical protein
MVGTNIRTAPNADSGRPGSIATTFGVRQEKACETDSSQLPNPPATCTQRSKLLFGLTDFLQVLDAERTLLDAENQQLYINGVRA